VGDVAARGDVYGGEQVPDLVAGQPNPACRGWALGAFGGGGDGEEGMGQHRQDRRAVPQGPAADLVLIQAGQSLTCLLRVNGGEGDSKLNCGRKLSLACAVICHLQWTRGAASRGTGAHAAELG
jgi:hypothetical protein